MTSCHKHIYIGTGRSTLEEQYIIPTYVAYKRSRDDVKVKYGGGAAVLLPL